MTHQRNLGKQFAATLAKLERAETDLTRAFNRWNKLRLALRRLGKQIDQDVLTMHQLAELDEGRRDAPR